MGFWRLYLLDFSVCWKRTIYGFCVIGCWKYGKKKICHCWLFFFFFVQVVGNMQKQFVVVLVQNLIMFVFCTSCW
jgi:hypothetical protein